jgi:putative transposase
VRPLSCCPAGIRRYERADHRTHLPQDVQNNAKLKPTPTQERLLERVLWRCRTLYNVALEQRITPWQRWHVCITRSQQEAELKAIREAFPEYAAIHSQVRHDVLARLDTTYRAFFRRVQHGEKPGFPRFDGKDRYHSFPYTPSHPTVGERISVLDSGLAARRVAKLQVYGETRYQLLTPLRSVDQMIFERR